MFSGGNRGSVAVLSLLLTATTLVQRSEAHPGCAPGTTSLTKDVETVFCPTDADPLYDDGICCDAGMEAEMMLKIEAAVFEGLPSGSRCAEMFQEVRGRNEEPKSQPLPVSVLSIFAKSRPPTSQWVEPSLLGGWEA